MTTTTTAPTLLDDDGSASMATALMMSHHGFRRDLARFAVALGRLAAGDQARAGALREEWPRFRATLHGHHEAEDKGLLPSLKTQHAALVPILDGLHADHRRIDPILEEGDAAFAGLPATAAAAAAASVVARLRELLAPHLATEEAHVIPHLRAAKQFPPPTSDAEAELYAHGFAWASHGVAEEVLERVWTMLPPSLASRLPAARAAFARRCEEVWGTAEAGASRTPVPDWIS
jgi:hypothetical protein